MKLFKYSILLLSFSGCTQAIDTNQPATKQMPTAAIEKVNTKIGKKFWASRTSIELCDSLTKDITACRAPAGSITEDYGPFLVKKAIFMDDFGQQVSFLITTPDGQDKFLRTYFQDNFVSDAKRKRQISALKAAKADCERRGGIDIGMSKQQVLNSCWGKPRKRNVTNTASGTHEQWVYGGGYVYLDNDIVRSIQTSE